MPFTRFTDLAMHLVRCLAALQGAGLDDARIVLADATTVLAHGPEAAWRAAGMTTHRYGHSHIRR